MTQPTYSASLLDPSGSHPLLAAVQWLEGTLLGTVATMVAVICVAVAGFMMLSGRIDVRYEVTVTRATTPYLRVKGLLHVSP
jgi:type IV secretory pathway VirB2 component (pilin)